MLELASDDECQAFPTGLVDDRQGAELAAIMGAALDEVSTAKPRANHWALFEYGSVHFGIKKRTAEAVP